MGEPILANRPSNYHRHMYIYIRVMDAAGDAGGDELDCLHKIILKSGIRFSYMI